VKALDLWIPGSPQRVAPTRRPCILHS